MLEQVQHDHDHRHEEHGEQGEGGSTPGTGGYGKQLHHKMFEGHGDLYEHKKNNTVLTYSLSKDHIRSADMSPKIKLLLHK